MIEKRIIINGLDINYFQSNNLNNENIIIFLHGWGSRATHLKNIFENIPSFVALDLPGFGESDCPLSSWGVADFAVFLENFLKKMEIKNPIFVGHSFGGSIIIKYLSEGNLAKKAILIASSGIRKKGFKIFFYKVIAKIFKIIFFLPGPSLIKDRVRKKFYSAIDSKDYIEAGKMVESYKRIIHDDLTDSLKKIIIPTALIWGEKDFNTPLWQGKLMRQKINNSKLYIIPNAGHFSFIDEPEEFNKIFSQEINVY